jgi:hypothetical protein
MGLFLWLDFLLRSKPPMGCSGIAVAKAHDLNFAMKKVTFDQFSSPVKVRVTLAFTRFHGENRKEFVVPEGESTLPDAGHCSIEQRFFQRIHCIAPLRGPSSLLITSDFSAGTCPLAERESRASAGDIGRGWTRNGDEPADFGINPVKEFAL